MKDGQWPLAVFRSFPGVSSLTNNSESDLVASGKLLKKRDGKSEYIGISPFKLVVAHRIRIDLLRRLFGGFRFRSGLRADPGQERSQNRRSCSPWSS